MTRFEELLQRGQRNWRDAFDDSCLDKRFIPYYNAHQRVRIRYRREDKDVMGHVGVTTGWRPVFLLIRRRNQVGSWNTLEESAMLVAEEVGEGLRKRWRPLT